MSAGRSFRISNILLGVIATILSRPLPKCRDVHIENAVADTVISRHVPITVRPCSEGKKTIDSELVGVPDF